MANIDSQPLTLRRILLVIATGVGAGFLSGLVGVGGGLVATLVSPSVGAILFNIFLLSIIASTILKMRRKARAQG